MISEQAIALLRGYGFCATTGIPSDERVEAICVLEANHDGKCAWQADRKTDG
jgi:hypothetical protein